MTDNIRYLVSRNKREGWYFCGFGANGKFKTRMHPINGKRASMREYAKWLKKGQS